MSTEPNPYQSEPNEANPNPDKIYENILASLSAIESITLPSQAGSLKYQFTYYAQESYPTEGNYTQGWGGLKTVTLPSGAKSEYQYSEPSLQTTDEVLKSYVTDKTLTYKEKFDGAETIKTAAWHYDITDSAAIVTAPDGSSSSQFFKSVWTNPSWDSGLVYQSNLPDGTTVRKNWKNKYSVEAEFTTLTNGLVAIKSYAYDSNSNITSVKEYDYYSGSLTTDANNKLIIPAGAVLKRETVSEYYNPAVSNFDSSLKLKGLPKSTEIRNGSGVMVARSEMFYDDANNKGNLTQTKSWDSTKGALATPDGNGYRLNTGNSISSSAQYNQYGGPTLMTDARGVQTQISYDSISTPSGAISGLYPTNTETAYNYPGLRRTSTAQYDFYTGLVTSATDVDNGLTSETVYDALGRPTTAKAAVGTPQEVWTQTEYDDAQKRVITRSDLFVKGDGKQIAIQHYDQLSRVRLIRRIENPDSEDPYNEQQGIKVQTRYLTEVVQLNDTQNSL